MLSAFIRGTTEILVSSLGLVFEDLERPDKPEGEHRGEATSAELTYFIVEHVRVTAETI